MKKLPEIMNERQYVMLPEVSVRSWQDLFFSLQLASGFRNYLLED